LSVAKSTEGKASAIEVIIMREDRDSVTALLNLRMPPLWAATIRHPPRT
jgi:hypothetical protein